MGNNPSHFQVAQHPVEKVSWHDAIDFCKKISQKIGRKVRLPTEAEWEYAAKGGKQSKGYEYAGSDNLDSRGWYDEDMVLRIFGGKTHPVGQKKANELSIYDMSGNVREWCLDEWQNANYRDKPDRLKINGNEPWGEVNTAKNYCFPHLIRGGCWFLGAEQCRLAFRDMGDADCRINTIGFRVVAQSGFS